MKKVINLAIVVFAMLSLGRLVASAQQPSQYSCIISNGQKCYVFYDGTGKEADTVCDEGSSGIGIFRGGLLQAKGRVAAELVPTDITVSIPDPIYGTITTTLDPTRQSGLATIQSIDQTNRFPLDVNISFHATASLQTAPGIVYKSRTQLVFSSSAVTSLNPFNGEVLTLKNDAEFYDAADTIQRTVFALQAGTTTVTLGVKKPQPKYSCILINGRKCYINYGSNGQVVDIVCDQGGTGIATFTSLTGAFSADSVIETELAPIDITATVSDSSHGTITTKLDPSRTSSVTTIRSADGRNRFPLDVNISFYATAALETAPGAIYRSRTQLVFFSRGVTSLNPFKGEVATLKDDVEFYDAADNTQRTKFTLQGGKTTVTLGTPNTPGPAYNCIVINGVKCYINYGPAGNPIDTTCDRGSKGIGTFRSLTGRLPVDSAVDAVLVPVDISASVSDPLRGTITTTLDPERPSSPTTIRSVDGRNRFPLAVDISFYATASLGSASGVTYKSRTQLVFSSKEVRSLDPFKNEVLTLKNDVEFYDAADPLRRTVFSLQRGRTTLTLSDGIAGVNKSGGVDFRIDLK